MEHTKQSSVSVNEQGCCDRLEAVDNEATENSATIVSGHKFPTQFNPIQDPDANSERQEDSIENNSVSGKDDAGSSPENSFLKDMIVLDTTGEPNGDAEEISLSSKSTSCDDVILFDSSVRKKADSSVHKKAKIGSECENDVVFLEGISIDVEGESRIQPNDNRHAPYPVQDIPLYSTGIAGILADIEYSMDTGKKINDARPKKTCFNCLGDHNITDCSEPHDPRRIAVNRKTYMNSRNNNVRYHEDCENKYGQFQPGKISDRLREALGLRRSDLPIYIYRMRCLGYPPGWLKEAEVHQADMKMYDGTGQSVIHPDSEEGETEATLIKYNPDKLVSYPGFNVDRPKGVHDDWQRLRFPPMKRHHRKSEFKHFMEMNKVDTYKKRKLRDENLQNNGNANVSEESLAMELDESGGNLHSKIEFNPPLPEEPLPPLPTDDSPASPGSLEVEEGEIAEDDSEHSVAYLEAKRQELLKELGNTGDRIENDDSCSEKDTEALDKNKIKSPSTPEADLENSVSSSSDTPSSGIVKHHRSHSKGYQLGVAIPSSITPYKILPEAEKWKVEVTDHINFENLPDALGTWDKMKGLMQQVKMRMLELHADDE
ncbi:Zinc finger CCHC domain-containing protein 8 [Halocaridina rubra]|uniref:Zinc finger CCHC domain-containing protein 8 n=1 Tax=Halocaridina rubra TaxID=373956 RepID=A0AAN9A6J4_HALRR